MILGHGAYTLSLSEREMSLVMDALDMATGDSVDTTFTRTDFHDTLRLFEERFAW